MMTNNPWLDIRNSAGHLLFRYNPFTNEVEFKKGGYVYELIRLDEIRERFCIPEVLGAVNPIVITVKERRNGS